MKLEHEVEGVGIDWFRTVEEALAAGLGKPSPVKAISGLVLNTLHLDSKNKVRLEKEEELAELLRQPLTGEYEDGMRHTETLALVSLEWEMERKEFYEELAKSDYYPAGLSESMSYLPILATKNIVVDAIFHLGTLLLNEKYTEFRLLTRSNGYVEAIPFYPATKLKPYYHVVVVMKEKK